MYGISVVVVTENAQDVIRDCLESVRWAEEIVVVDAGSTDKTIEIVAKYTDRIVMVDPGLNSGQRWNRGIEAASQNWIFVLESDKRAPLCLKTELDKIVNGHKLEDADGYLIKTRNYFLGHWVKMSNFYPDYKLYIFRKGTARFEQRHGGGIEFSGKSKNLNGYIEHRVHRSLQQYFSKLNKGTDRLAEELFTKQADFKKRYMITKPLRIFKKQYFKQGGSKEGIVGLLLSLICAFERFLLYAKRWEIEKRASVQKEPWKSKEIQAEIRISTMPKQMLSAVIITKNEEDKIGRCLKSVKWADEIIVVDDLSTDRTVEICRKYGAKVISHKLQGNFSQQRNIGIDNVSCSWILQMDADEIIPEELRNEIQKTVSCNSEFSSFQFRRKNFFLGHFMRYGGFYGPYSLKLFKRGKGRYVKPIHEELKIDGKIGIIGADIEHYPFQSIAQNIERNNVYSTIRAKLMKEEKGALDKKELRYNLTIRPLKSFWKMYVKKRGYKDGMYGLIFCILFTFGPMLRWMKYWELTRDKK